MHYREVIHGSWPSTPMAPMWMVYLPSLIWGIVTKIGVWLMPAPPAYKPFMLSLQKRDDIAQAVDILRPLKINVIVPNSVVISNALLDAAPFSKRKDYLIDGKVDLDKIKRLTNWENGTCMVRFITRPITWMSSGPW